MTAFIILMHNYNLYGDATTVELQSPNATSATKCKKRVKLNA